MSEICINHFKDLLGKTMSITEREGQQHHLTIVEVENEKHSCDRWLNGSVVLQGGENTCLEQDTYSIACESVQSDNILISPIGNQEHEIIFSHDRK